MQELAECGEYESVEVIHALDSGCGGVIQLRQVRKCICVVMRTDCSVREPIPHQELRSDQSDLLFTTFILGGSFYNQLAECDFSLKDFKESVQRCFMKSF